MPTHGQVAARVRARKEANPLHYCPSYNCLWRTYHRMTDTFTPCGNHGLLHPSVPAEKVRL